MKLIVYRLRAVSANHGHDSCAQIRGEAVRIFTHLLEALKSLVNDRSVTKNAESLDQFAPEQLGGKLFVVTRVPAEPLQHRIEQGANICLIGCSSGLALF